MDAKTKEIAEQAKFQNYALGNGAYIVRDPELERFAALIRHDEAKACAEHYLPIMRDAVEQAVLKEREACAKLCDELSATKNGYGCARAIRARGKK